MTDLTVRRLLIDLKAPFAPDWCGGDAFLSAFFNALSMSFPVGEQYFIDAVRSGFATLPVDQQDRWRAEVQGFVGQEATHRHIHAQFNRHLEEQGLVNAWEPRARQRMALLDGVDPRHPLAITAANEHFTALFADWLLRHPHIFGDAEPRLRTLWLWHSAEEAEHKCTAFDLYRALGGSEAWRRTWMKRITLVFLGDTLRQTVLNLRLSGQLWKWSTWRSAWRHLLGRDGLLRQSWAPWRRYFRADFHPGEQDDRLARDWLTHNQAVFREVGSMA